MASIKIIVLSFKFISQSAQIQIGYSVCIDNIFKRIKFSFNKFYKWNKKMFSVHMLLWHRAQFLIDTDVLKGLQL